MILREVHILSYFTLSTDLAAEMRLWREFISGEGYTVHLKSESEAVDVSLEKRQDESFVQVRGTGTGPLFERVLGCVVYALGAHSDNLMVDRIA
jgi:hypothetical protein